jgi:ABC-2 type transport system ATP-binding protein
LGRDRTLIVSTHILSDIDQICDHLGVMHQGRMIFAGPMQELRRRLRRDDISLELQGSDAELQQLAGQVRQMADIDA